MLQEDEPCPIIQKHLGHFIGRGAISIEFVFLQLGLVVLNCFVEVLQGESFFREFSCNVGSLYRESCSPGRHVDDSAIVLEKRQHFVGELHCRVEVDVHGLYLLVEVVREFKEVDGDSCAVDDGIELIPLC